MEPTSVTPETPTMPHGVPYPYVSPWMFLYDPMFSIVGPIMLISQIACLVHVFKTGRPYWWMYVIFCFPVVGIAAYIFLEVKPTWGKLNMQGMLWNLKSSRERIAIRRQILDESSTIRNRLALADELQAARQHDEAKIKISRVGERSDQTAARSKQTAQLAEDRLRFAQVFENVRADDGVEAFA